MEERIRELKAQLVSNMANRKQLLKGRHNRDLQGTERAKGHPREDLYPRLAELPRGGRG